MQSLQRLLRLALLVGALLGVLAACSSSAAQQETSGSSDKPVVQIYYPASCGCCGAWVAYMETNGFEVEKIPIDNPQAVKERHAVPPALYSCHTAVVDGYVLEGHVPAAEITRLLAERPSVVGLAVPGMPLGSPGMETPDGAVQPYDVLTFDQTGATTVYAEYGR